MMASSPRPRYPILSVLGGLALWGLIVGAGWAALIAGFLTGGDWLFVFVGALYMGAPFGLAVGVAAGLLLSIELLIHKQWLESPNFPLKAAAQVTVGCLIFLPAELFPRLAFSGTIDSIYQLFVFKLIPAPLAGFFTWRFLRELQSRVIADPAR